MQRYLITCILANTIANILYFLEIGFTIELHCAPEEAHKKANKNPRLRVTSGCSPPTPK